MCCSCIVKEAETGVMCGENQGELSGGLTLLGLSDGEMGWEDLRKLGGSRVVGGGLTHSTAPFRDSAGMS